MQIRQSVSGYTEISRLFLQEWSLQQNIGLLCRAHCSRKIYLFYVESHGKVNGDYILIILIIPIE